MTPYAKWFDYEISGGEPIIDLRNKGEAVFDRCINYDVNEWLFASVGNVTYLENGQIRSISCVNGTETQVFRWIRDVSDYLNGSIYSSSHNFLIGVNLELAITISYGTPDSYHQNPQIASFSPADLLFRVESVFVQNTGFECFAQTSLNPIENLSNLYVKLMCQRTSGNFVDYISVLDRDVLDGFRSKVDLFPRYGSKQYSNSTSVLSSLLFVGRAEFPGQPAFTAEHIINTESYFRIIMSQASLESYVRRILYTKRENRTTNVRLRETKTVTDLDSVFLSVFGIEIILAIIFGITMFVIARYKLQVHEIPTILNKLSKCCVASQSSTSSGNGRYIVFKLSHHSFPTQNDLETNHD